jgi:hypothetical protein
MQKRWLDADGNDDVAVYVVWSSQLGAEERHVPAAAALIPDRRVAHFWDASQVVGKAFQPIVGTPVPSWDVWMVFDRQARWNGELPPRPAWWEHQLHSLPPERYLDPKRFAKKARALEARKAAGLKCRTRVVLETWAPQVRLARGGNARTSERSANRGRSGPGEVLLRGW